MNTAAETKWAPKVKVLEWEGPYSPGNSYHAKSLLGVYAYWPKGDRWFATCPIGVDAVVRTEESARDFCQGHFQASIFSVLDFGEAR